MLRYFSSEDGKVHSEGACGNDVFLCGFAYEGENGYAEIKVTRDRINCRACVTVIKFCRKIRKNEIDNDAE